MVDEFCFLTIIGSDRTSFPAIDPPNENIIVPMAAKRTEPSTSEPPPPATPDQNNYEGN